MAREEALARLQQFMNERGQEFGLTSLGVFGSVARGTAREDSDLDVVFTCEEPNLFRISRMRQDLEAYLGLPVDVIRLQEYLPASLKEAIQRDAVYV